MSADVLVFPARGFNPARRCDCARCDLEGLAQRLRGRISAGAGSMLVPADFLEESLADLLKVTQRLLATAIEVPK